MGNIGNFEIPGLKINFEKFKNRIWIDNFENQEFWISNDMLCSKMMQCYAKTCSMKCHSELRLGNSNFLSRKRILKFCNLKMSLNLNIEILRLKNEILDFLQGLILENDHFALYCFRRTEMCRLRAMSRK